MVQFLFQSTPSVKRVTLINVISDKTQLIISIHTLCEEGDFYIFIVGKIDNYFNPHPLWRGWQLTRKLVNGLIAISIHTLCEEGDLKQRLF